MDGMFEWDERKCASNLAKHNVDFEDAIEVFNDFYRFERKIYSYGEKRYITIGQVYSVLLLVVYTKRGIKKRLISARPASRKERMLYEKAS